MAIVQVSRITHRKGLSENLPQLAGAELGWVIDERKLYIGNGTLAEGAPAIGNTEILTQYSDILSVADSYTYKGQAAGYTVQTGTSASAPSSRTLQRKLDDFASVKDFGATGDGSTDDTAAINRALFQLFCRNNNVATRRSLYFPAGTYLITEPIKVPPHAKLYGEGSTSSIIKLSSSATGSYVMQTADSLQQTGSNIGDNSATTPVGIELVSLRLQTDKTTDIALVEDATQMLFQNVDFVGPLTTATLTTAGDDVACVRFASTLALITSNIVFDRCLFTGTTYGFDVDEHIEKVTVTNSKFNILYKGAQLGSGTLVDGGPNGFTITQSIFDNIYAEGIETGPIELVSSASNTFYDVGNSFDGAGNPATNNIVIGGDNSNSIGDLFQRNTSDSESVARTAILNKKSIVFDNGERIQLGANSQKAGGVVDLSATGSLITIFTFRLAEAPVFKVKYSFAVTATNGLQYGTFTVVGADTDDSVGSMVYEDEYLENQPTGLVLSAVQIGTAVSLQYTATDAGSFKYTIEYIN